MISNRRGLCGMPPSAGFKPHIFFSAEHGKWMMRSATWEINGERRAVFKRNDLAWAFVQHLNIRERRQ